MRQGRKDGETSESGKDREKVHQKKKTIFILFIRYSMRDQKRVKQQN